MQSWHWEGSGRRGQDFADPESERITRAACRVKVIVALHEVPVSVQALSRSVGRRLSSHWQLHVAGLGSRIII